MQGACSSLGPLAVYAQAQADGQPILRNQVIGGTSMPRVGAKPPAPLLAVPLPAHCTTCMLHMSFLMVQQGATSQRAAGSTAFVPSHQSGQVGMHACLNLQPCSTTSPQAQDAAAQHMAACLPAS